MIEFVVIAICVVINGFLAAIEMAFVTVTRSQIRELSKNGKSAARHAVLLRENPERTLSIIQVGITVVGSIAAAVGGVSATNAWGPWLSGHLDISENLAKALAIVCIVLPL
ncbi:MAG: CNNM domain-containing protein, partial [Bdellovibrionota bacterium]